MFDSKVCCPPPPPLTIDGFVCLTVFSSTIHFSDFFRLFAKSSAPVYKTNKNSPFFFFYCLLLFFGRFQNLCFHCKPFPFVVVKSLTKSKHISGERGDEFKTIPCFVRLFKSCTFPCGFISNLILSFDDDSLFEYLHVKSSFPYELSIFSF